MEKVRDLQFLHHITVFSGELHAGEILLEPMQTESIVDALLEHASQIIVSLQYQDVFAPGSICTYGSCHTGCATAYYY